MMIKHLSRIIITGKLKKQYLELFVICHDVEMILKKLHLILNVFYTLISFH